MLHTNKQTNSFLKSLLFSVFFSVAVFFLLHFIFSKIMLGMEGFEKFYPFFSYTAMAIPSLLIALFSLNKNSGSLAFCFLSAFTTAVLIFLISLPILNFSAYFHIAFLRLASFVLSAVLFRFLLIFVLSKREPRLKKFKQIHK